MVWLTSFLFSCSENLEKPDRSKFMSYAVNYFNENDIEVRNLKIDTVLMMSSQKAELLRVKIFETEQVGRLSINHYLKIVQLDSVEQKKKRAEKLPNNDIIGYRVKFLFDYVKPTGKLDPGVWPKTFDTDYKPLDEFDWATLDNEFFLMSYE
nr:hypothetical protein [uncultured Fluviicola sp.]